MLCSYLCQCFAALDTLPGPCLQFEFDLIKGTASRRWSKLCRECTEPDLHSRLPRRSVVQHGSPPRPLARVAVGNSSLCPVEDTKASSVPGRALKQEQTTSYSMQVLFSTNGCAVSQGCDYKAEETRSCCLLINIWLVRQPKSPLYMLNFGSAGHAGLAASCCGVHSAPWLHTKQAPTCCNTQGITWLCLLINSIHLIQVLN